MPVQKITREEILERAIDVFGRQGYHRTSMHDLAAACGLFKGSFYHYFGSKEELMGEVLSYSLGYFRKHVFAIAYDEALTPVGRLRSMMDKSGAVIMHNNRGCLFGNTVLETANVTAQFRETLQAFFTDWTNALVHLYQSKYDPQTAQDHAQQTVMELEGAVMLMKLTGNPQVLSQCTARILKRFGE